MEQKLRAAWRYVNERTASLNLLEPYTSEERFVDSEGGFSCVYADVIQFEGVQSLKQVLDAAQYYFSNMEISISERLGHLTVREDYHSSERNITNFRMVSSDSNGIDSEMNSVAMTEYFDGSDPFGEPVAISVCDSVDEDELFPYESATRVRKDFSGAIVLTTHRRKRPSTANDSSNVRSGEATSDDQDELVVVLRRAGFVRFHPAKFAVPPLALQEFREGITCWLGVMLKSIRETVYLK